MRSLLLMRGAPGAGKSTWIKNNGLENYVVSPDNLRQICSTPKLNPDGTYCISQERDNEAAVWEILWKILEHRMQNGEFTVVDATCSKTKDIQQYKDLANQYRYRIFIVDFTTVPLEVCLKQNKQRDPLKWVPEAAIRNIYARFATQPIPGGVKVIKPDEFKEVLYEQPIDLSEYKRIVHIGDIHGCYDTLIQYPDFKEGLKDDTCYIFCGDYLDRGNQNAEVFKFISSIAEKPNVCLLEGNHERHIRDFGNDVTSVAKEFEYKTKRQLINGEITARDARMLYRHFRQMSHYTFNGLEVLACHGGIPSLKNNLLYLPTKDFVKGVGNYEDYLQIADTWMRESQPNQFLIHGHRNVEADPMQIADRVYNLEGAVEFGGAIRIVELNADLTWKEVLLDDCQPVDENINTETRTVETVADAVTYLKNNRHVQEKDLGDGISSFNFTREAFFRGNWTKQTILARGLFIDTVNNKIMARSYEKFFKVNEVHATELASLKEKLVFPVTAYVKENGFLAIVSYDYNKDDLFIASKSTNKGEYVEYIKAQLEPYKDVILNSLRSYYNSDQEHTGVSFIFECEDIDNDPHIIKYDKSNLVLLDAVYNELTFRKMPYNDLQSLANLLGIPCKEKAITFKNWDEFRNLYYQTQTITYKYNDQYIEGFVFEDANGFMVKAKTEYYNQWKKLRGVAEQTLKQGYVRATGMLYTELENLFYGFCRELYNKDYDKENKTYPYKTDIISLREMFMNKGSY